MGWGGGVSFSLSFQILFGTLCLAQWSHNIDSFAIPVCLMHSSPLHKLLHRMHVCVAVCRSGCRFGHLLAPYCSKDGLRYNAGVPRTNADCRPADLQIILSIHWHPAIWKFQGKRKIVRDRRRMVGNDYRGLTKYWLSFSRIYSVKFVSSFVTSQWGFLIKCFAHQFSFW